MAARCLLNHLLLLYISLSFGVLPSISVHDVLSINLTTANHEWAAAGSATPISITLWFNFTVYQCILFTELQSQTYSTTDFTILGSSDCHDASPEAKLMIENDDASTLILNSIAFSTANAWYGIEGRCFDETQYCSDYITNESLCISGTSNSWMEIDNQDTDCGPWPYKQIFYFDTTRRNQFINDAAWSDATNVTIATCDPTTNPSSSPSEAISPLVLVLIVVLGIVLICFLVFFRRHQLEQQDNASTQKHMHNDFNFDSLVSTVYKKKSQNVHSEEYNATDDATERKKRGNNHDDDEIDLAECVRRKKTTDPGPASPKHYNVEMILKGSAAMTMGAESSDHNMMACEVSDEDGTQSDDLWGDDSSEEKAQPTPRPHRDDEATMEEPEGVQNVELERQKTLPGEGVEVVTIGGAMHVFHEDEQNEDGASVTEEQNEGEMNDDGDVDIVPTVNRTIDGNVVSI